MLGSDWQWNGVRVATPIGRHTAVPVDASSSAADACGTPLADARYTRIDHTLVHVTTQAALMSETLHSLLAAGSLACRIVRNELVISDGPVKTFAVLPVLRAARCRFHKESKTWRCPATDDLLRAVQQGRELMQRQSEEARVSDERAACVLSGRMDSISACVLRHVNAHARRMAVDKSFNRRDFMYGKRLLWLCETNNAPLGSDGAPSWPDPPDPMSV